MAEQKTYDCWEAHRLALETPGRVFLDVHGFQVMVARNGSLLCLKREEEGWRLDGTAFSGERAPFRDPEAVKSKEPELWKQVRDCLWKLGYEAERYPEITRAIQLVARHEIARARITSRTSHCLADADDHDLRIIPGGDDAGEG